MSALKFYGCKYECKKTNQPTEPKQNWFQNIICKLFKQTCSKRNSDFFSNDANKSLVFLGKIKSLI